MRRKGKREEESGEGRKEEEKYRNKKGRGRCE
jgi:hypothetical protein